MASVGKKTYRAQQFGHYPKHGRLRTYWQAKNGAGWSCGHIHHSQEVAAECADRLNGEVVSPRAQVAKRST
jgi:hypothetical protein